MDQHTMEVNDIDVQRVLVWLSTSNSSTAFIFQRKKFLEMNCETRGSIEAWSNGEENEQRCNCLPNEWLYTNVYNVESLRQQKAHSQSYARYHIVPCTRSSISEECVRFGKRTIMCEDLSENHTSESPNHPLL